MFFQLFIPCSCRTPLAHLILGIMRVCGNCHLCIIRTKLICLHEVIIPNAVWCFCIYGFNLELYLVVGLFAQHTKSADLCGDNGVAMIWTMAMLQRYSSKVPFYFLRVCTCINYTFLNKHMGISDAFACAQIHLLARLTSQLLWQPRMECLGIWLLNTWP